MAFTKLFSSIITSTIWMEDDQTRIVWITLLALADQNGEVQGSVPGLARLAGVPVEACRAALLTFLSPDPDSRTKDDEGRRIEEVEGGWLLLNHTKYRKMATKEEQIAKATERTRRYRARRKRNGVSTVCDGKSTDVHDISTEAEAEAEAEAEERNDIAAKAAHPIAEAVALFNAAAAEHDWPQVQNMSANRTRALKACLTAVGGIEGWQAMLAKVTASDFLMGRTARSDDHANWRFSFDFLVKPMRYTKVMEGSYDNRTANGQQSSHERQRQALAEWSREGDR